MSPPRLVVPPRRRSRTRRVLFAGCAFGLAWLLLEAGAGWTLARLEAAERPTSAAYARAPNWVSMTRFALAAGFFVGDPDCLWRTRPGFRYGLSEPTWGNKPVVVNEHGHRSPSMTLAKPPGVRRVMVLGGSQAFGMWAADDETYSARLQVLLDAIAPDGWQVLNAASPGHTSFQALQYLIHHGLAFSPDVVVFDLGLNDAIPLTVEYARPDDEVQMMSRPTAAVLWIVGFSRVYRLLRRQLGPVVGRSGEGGVRVPPERRDANLRAVGELGAAHGFDVLYVSQVRVPSRRDGMASCVFRADGFEPLLDVCALFEAMGPGAGAHFADDSHANASGHELIAEALLARLQEAGSLPR